MNIHIIDASMSELCETDFNLFKERGFTDIIYWYTDGEYDGYGHALMNGVDGWGFQDLGHCSCYPAGDGGDCMMIEYRDESVYQNIDEGYRHRINLLWDKFDEVYGKKKWKNLKNKNQTKG